MRIYLVGTPEGETRLVRAANRQHAVWYVAQSKYVVRAAGQDDLVELIGQDRKSTRLNSSHT